MLSNTKSYHIITGKLRYEVKLEKKKISRSGQIKPQKCVQPTKWEIK